MCSDGRGAGDCGKGSRDSQGPFSRSPFCRGLHVRTINVRKATASLLEPCLLTAADRSIQPLWTLDVTRRAHTYVAAALAHIACWCCVLRARKGAWREATARSCVPRQGMKAPPCSALGWQCAVNTSGGKCALGAIIELGWGWGFPPRPVWPGTILVGPVGQTTARRAAADPDPAVALWRAAAGGWWAEAQRRMAMLGWRDGDRCAAPPTPDALRHAADPAPCLPAEGAQRSHRVRDRERSRRGGKKNRLRRI